MEVRAIVLAAGKGTRMNTELPKCALRIIDKPMAEYVIDSLKAVNVEKIITVVGYKREVLGAILVDKTEFAYQEEQLGTAHAVSMTEDFMKDYSGTTLIALGDMPMITSATYAKLIEHHALTDADLTVLTTDHPNPFGYGRIIRNQVGDIIKIVEDRFCTPEQKKITEINSSIYLVDNQKLFSSIYEIKNNNSQKEYYLTDIVEIFNQRGYRVSGYQANDYQEISGANDLVQLSEMENYLQAKIIKKHLLAGVAIHRPETVVIGCDVEIESGAIILPGSIIVGKSKIEKGTIIGPYAEINNSTVGLKAIVRYSRIKNSQISENIIVGPYVEIIDNEGNEKKC
ncbi:MAG TPA: NTP transferase domain-containing protein [Acholeplasmataceae bacterium]|nr:NTP transferase domain-containing protein [Acholeplasmataceae bacterium]